MARDSQELVFYGLDNRPNSGAAIAIPAQYADRAASSDRVLPGRRDVGLRLDAGHLLVGGGDPVKGIEDWGDRINHVPLKDAKRGVVDGILKAGASVEAIWRRRAFCRLGEADVDVERFLSQIKEIAYPGWLVVEQDTMPDPAWPLERAAADQVANRRYLRLRGI